MKLEIEKSVSPDGTHLLRTRGLRRKGRPEIEVEAPSSASLDESQELIVRVARLVAESPARGACVLDLPGDGDRPPTSVALREARSEPSGLFGRGWGLPEQTVFRVESPG